MSSTDLLLNVATAARLFHASDGTGFADLFIEGHRETWPLRSKRFQAWLRQQYYERTWDAPSPAALNTALNVLEAQAQFDGPERTVSVRLAEQDGLIYLDLADEFWRCVEIGANGWRIAEDPPVRFRRSAGMQPLPLPVRGGSIEALAPFLNLASENDFVLVVAWLLGALRAGGPYPVLAIAGEQGSAKTVLSKLLRAVIDPSVAPVRALPRDERELFIAASNGHVLAFDNLSGLPPWLSDTLCRLTSGGAFSTRRLFTDQDEILFAAARPLILNGIEDVITRPDLADRALFLTLAIHIGKRSAGRRRSFGRSSSSPVPASWGPCLMRQARVANAASRAPRSAAADGRFRHLGHGLRNSALAQRRICTRLRGNRRAAIEASSTPTRWPLACGRSWPSAAPGQAAPPTFCVPAPILPHDGISREAPAGPKIPARSLAACAARRPSSGHWASTLSSVAKAEPERRIIRMRATVENTVSTVSNVRDADRDQDNLRRDRPTRHRSTARPTGRSRHSRRRC